MRTIDRLQAYVYGVGLVTAVVLALAVVHVAEMPTARMLDLLPLVALLAVACWVGSQLQVYDSESNAISTGTVGQIAALLLLPLPLALLTTAFAKFWSEMTRGIRQGALKPRAVAVNTGSTALAVGTAGLGFHLFQGPTYLWSGNERTLLSLPAITVLTALYTVIDFLVVVGAISMSGRDSPWKVFRSLYRGIFGPMVSMTLVGMMVAVVWHYSPVFTIFMVIPVIFTLRSFAAANRLRQETIQAVLKMAESIDLRDTGTYEHSQRLAEFTRKLAVRLGLVAEHVSEIVLAARVHDLGKIGISNDILLKQGPLTLEERNRMDHHPSIGADILESYSAFRNSVAIVRHHHERWDGKGYPSGLKGEEIPLGSRIIAVVDAFDAMTADRPYRKGMCVEAAVARLKDGIGTQFDPTVCAQFLQILIEDGTYVPPVATTELRIVRADAG